MRFNSRTLALALSLLGLAASARAQGSDDCATAQVIAGVGVFSYSNFGKTTGTQGQVWPDCSHFFDTAVYRDVWFAWTAPATGKYMIETCGLTSFDTKLAIYAGAGCPAVAPLMCNDDSSCGIASQVIFDAVNGGTYVLQLGSSSSTSSGGNGGFEIALAPAVIVCGPNSGPDLIVGDVPSLSNFTSSAGFDMVAMGTTACNIGTLPANWIADTNDHPVIRQNVYKHQVVGGAGRFEQLGISWLKHGFGSSQDSTCCTCNPGGNFSHCGAGCSDTYSSSQNGAQTGVSGNWQVNAHTGTFAYPPANPSFSGTPARRCQIALASLTPSSGNTRFFGEVHYVTKDDALAGNQNNNASWIELAVSGGPSDFSFAYQGALHTEQPAIHAWATFDPGVTFTEVQIPGDGLIVVGSRATPVGDGMWHYEFAVYNMNADRAVGSFAVPLPPGISLSAIGFHDVAYHDGDGNGSVNFSSADWIGTQTATAITWACQTQAANTNANAIRWGSLYNFRFNANLGPHGGAVTFTPWKTGSPASLLAAAQVPGTNEFASFCSGDGSVGACPCGNLGAPDFGCGNSVNTGGAHLDATGSPSPDTIDFTISGMPPGVGSIFLQGSAVAIPALAFGDGLRCAAGQLTRLGLKNDTDLDGITTLGPGSGDPQISVSGSVLPGTTYYYQTYYRNPNASWCPPATFNISNGWVISWQ